MIDKVTVNYGDVIMVKLKDNNIPWEPVEKFIEKLQSAVGKNVKIVVLPSFIDLTVLESK